MKGSSLLQLVAIALSVEPVAHVQTESRQLGTLRITSPVFQYLTDHEAVARHDSRTYGGLGPLATYMVSVIPASALNREAASAMDTGTLNDYPNETLFSITRSIRFGS